MLILSEEKKQKCKVLDKISEFSIRPPELRFCFDQVGMYYRWFTVSKVAMSKEDVLGSLSKNINRSSWIDGKSCKVVFREKALDEILFWLENSIAKDDDFHNNIGKQNTYELFFNIKEALNNPQINIDYVEFI